MVMVMVRRRKGKVGKVIRVIRMIRVIRVGKGKGKVISRQEESSLVNALVTVRLI